VLGKELVTNSFGNFVAISYAVMDDLEQLGQIYLIGAELSAEWNITFLRH
jgi:hypothetical protein